MANPLTLKRGDTSPDFEYELTEPDISLVNAKDVVIIIRRDLDSVKVYDRVPVAVVKEQWDASGGPVVFVEVTTALTGTTGDYSFEVEVTYADGEVETCPKIGYEKIIVTQDLG